MFVLVDKRVLDFSLVENGIPVLSSTTGLRAIDYWHRNVCHSLVEKCRSHSDRQSHIGYNFLIGMHRYGQRCARGHSLNTPLSKIFERLPDPLWASYTLHRSGYRRYKYIVRHNSVSQQLSSNQYKLFHFDDHIISHQLLHTGWTC